MRKEFIDLLRGFLHRNGISSLSNYCEIAMPIFTYFSCVEINHHVWYARRGISDEWNKLEMTSAEKCESLFLSNVTQISYEAWVAPPTEAPKCSNHGWRLSILLLAWVRHSIHIRPNFNVFERTPNGSMTRWRRKKDIFNRIIIYVRWFRNGRRTRASCMTSLC